MQRSGSQQKSAGKVRSLLNKVVIDTRPLRYPAYRRLWLSNVVVALGGQFTVVAVPKQLYDLTGSSSYVGLAGLAGLLPLLVFGLWGGAVADAVDRRRLMVITTAGLAGSAALLWLTTATGLASVGSVLLLYALQQVFFAINMPTRNAAIARLILTELLSSAQALNTTVFQLGAIIGPLLAGMLLPFIGLSALYLLDALALGAVLWAAWRLPPLPPQDGAPTRAGLRAVLDGFRYLSVHTVLLASYLVDIIAMVFGLPRALFPAMAEQTFGSANGNGAALGWLYAAIPLGSFAAGLFSGWLHRFVRHGVGVVLAVIAWGLAVIGFGLADSLWLGVLFLALGGGADLVSMVYRGAILQEAATDEMRGRLQGVFTVVVTGGPRLADVLHGLAGDWLGTRLAVVGGGVLVVVCTLLAAVALPAFWQYRAPR